MKIPFCIIAGCFIFAFALLHTASANLVLDPTFTGVTYSGTTPGLTTLYGQFGTETGSTLTVANWSTSGYNFVYAPGTGDIGSSAAGANSGQPKEAPGQYNYNGYGNTYMWGPNNGSANGLPSTDPVGGNYIAMDGAYEVAAISQTITGLTVGQVYALKFYWAAAQQQSFTGATTENITATLGSQSFTTTTYDLTSEGFSGWMQQTFDFTATSTSETLSFLAAGTPSGEPPFTLLGGVDLELVPDSSNWMGFLGFGAVCIVFQGLRRRQRRKAQLGKPEGLAPFA